jgi:peroxiredoxin
VKLFAALLTIIVVSSAIAINAQSSTERTTPITVGAVAPDFTLEGHNGQKVTLSESRGKNPVVLVFYRGYWCPYCARQLAELRSLVQKGENTRVYAISIDSPEVSRSLAEKLAADGKGKVDFPLLSDQDHKVIDSYGLHDPAYDGQKFDGIPKAAVYVIDKNGKVAWAKVEANYRQRPTNQEIRLALDALN